MKFICKELSSKACINILKTFLLSIILTSICVLFLPTVSVEGKTNHLDNTFVNESTENIEKLILNNSDHHLVLNKSINKHNMIDMKQVKGQGQSIQWFDEVLNRVNVVVESCKGKFSSIDMILMPLNLNSNQWINR